MLSHDVYFIEPLSAQHNLTQVNFVSSSLGYKYSTCTAHRCNHSITVIGFSDD